MGAGHSVTHNTSYSFIDEFVIPGQTYQYRLGDVDYSGGLEYHHEISVTVKTIDDIEHPQAFILKPAYPNPFNPNTSIQYNLLKTAIITVTIYDISGKRVTTLVSEVQDAGYKSVRWDALNDHGQPVSAGVYIYQVIAGEFIQTRKMVLLK